MATKTKSKVQFDVWPLNVTEVVVAWDMLFIALMDSGLYAKDTFVAQILMDAAAGKLQVWLMRRIDEEGRKSLDGVLVTEIRDFAYTGDKILYLIHANTLSRSFDESKWQNVYKALGRYAQREGCTRARIFTENANLQRLLESFGFRPVGLFDKEL